MKETNDPLTNFLVKSPQVSFMEKKFTSLTLLCMGGALGPPLRFWPLEWSEGPQILVQFIYDIENWFYGKKISKNFQKKFSIFCTSSTQKKIFLHFWAKNNFLLYTWRETCSIDPLKIVEAYSTKCPWNALTLTSQSPYKAQ